MAKLYIREWSGIAGDKQAPSGFIKDQVVDFSGGVAASAAFSDGCAIVEWSTDAICFWVYGSNPTATTSNMRYAADSRGFIGAVPGCKISVISNT